MACRSCCDEHLECVEERELADYIRSERFEHDELFIGYEGEVRKLLRPRRTSLVLQGARDLLEELRDALGDRLLEDLTSDSDEDLTGSEGESV